MTHVNSACQKDKPTSIIFQEHEDAKKRQYQQRILEIEHGSFTPLVLGTNGGMGSECSKFLSVLANKIAEKENEQYSKTISWIRTRLSFEIMRGALLCIRGSRTPFKAFNREEVKDFELMSLTADLSTYR